MKFLTVCVLGWAMMALTRVAESSNLVKECLLCCNGWTKINGGCFKYVPQTMTWAQAEKNCQSMDAHLASVQSKNEYKEIQKLTAPDGYKETWIGGSDAQEEKNWFWIDGEKFVYKHWCEGEPNNYKGSQHCLKMNYKDQKCWDDDQCDTSLPSVCAQRGCGVAG